MNTRHVAFAWFLIAGVLCFAGGRSAAGEALPKTSRVWAKDFDGWSTEPFCGTPSCPLPPGFFRQGPRLESGCGGRIAVADDGTAYVGAGTFIYRVSAAGRVELLAGKPGVGGYRDGPADRALIGGTGNLFLGPQGALIFMSGGFLRKLTPSPKGPWLLSTVAGSAKARGRKDGPALQAGFKKVHGLTVFDDGRIFIMDGNYLRVLQDGEVKTLNPKGGFGFKDGPLETARFNVILTGSCLTGDAKDLLWIADKWNNIIRKVDVGEGTITTAAGGPPRSDPASRLPKGHDPFRDGPAMYARFHRGGGVSAVHYDPRGNGNIYIGVADERYTRVLQNDGWVRSLKAGFPSAFDKRGWIYLGGKSIRRMRTLKPGQKPFEWEPVPKEAPLFKRPAFDPKAIPPDVHRHRIPVPAASPKIDGKLDDACWKRVPVHVLKRTNGTEADADTATEVRILADKRNLYLGVRCLEPEMSRMKVSSRPHDDGTFYNDHYVEFFVIPSIDPRDPAYQVMLNNAGQTWDGRNKQARTWNPKLTARAWRGASEWTVEVALPIREIPGAAENASWRMNVSRFRPRQGRVRARETTWSLLYSSSSHAYARFNVVTVAALAGAGGE
jgi:hypothetical protein